jgi:hypothetical protein
MPQVAKLDLLSYLSLFIAVCIGVKWIIHVELSQLAYAIGQVPGTPPYLAENVRISERGYNDHACPRLTRSYAVNRKRRMVVARVYA